MTSDELLAAATSRPWSAERRGEYGWAILGNRHFSHADDSDEEPCECACDGPDANGDPTPECVCGEHCCFTAVRVGIVEGNATAGDIPEANARLIVAAVNAYRPLQETAPCA